MTDNEIIRLILQGDKDKFRDLVEQYQQMVFRTSMGYLHNKEDAEDLTQDIFIQVWKALPGFKGESAFATWLYRIAVNASLNKTRKSSKSFILQSIESLFHSVSAKASTLAFPEDDDPEKIMIRQEHVKWLQNALDRLPENQRTAIILSKYDDLSQIEISEIMNLSEGAVEALLHRARKNLRDYLTASQKNYHEAP